MASALLDAKDPETGTGAETDTVATMLIPALEEADSRGIPKASSFRFDALIRTLEASDERGAGDHANGVHERGASQA